MWCEGGGGGVTWRAVWRCWSTAPGVLSVMTTGTSVTRGSCAISWASWTLCLPSVGAATPAAPVSGWACAWAVGLCLGSGPVLGQWALLGSALSLALPTHPPSRPHLPG